MRNEHAAAALVVHDLKNELGALESELDALAAAPTGDAARAAAERCHELRRRFVMYLAVYGGSALKALPADESPSGFLQSFAQRQARHGAVQRLRCECAPDLPPWAYFDARLVALALEAALHNARRFARSEIVLGLRAGTGGLVFSVEDDGPGLAAECDDDEQSTGLGTELCRAVARAHGATAADGGVRLADRPGGGARFELAIAT